MAGDQDVDVLVVGGGPAGISTALSLTRRGKSVVLIERSCYDRTRVGEAFPPGINRELARLDLLNRLSDVPHTSSAGIRSTWGGPDPFDRSFLFDPYGDGWHVERRVFDATLAEAAAERGVRVSLNTSLRDLRRRPTGEWAIQLNGNGAATTVTARFVVDATGRASVVARRLRVRRAALDRLVGVYGFFRRRAGDGHDIVQIEPAEDGWWYSAPLPHDQFAVGFMTDADPEKPQTMRDRATWLAGLERTTHTWPRVSRASLAAGPQVFVASSSRLDAFYGPDWLAVGDAAYTEDPLSGQGVCRSLGSGVVAADAICACQSGDDSALSEYGKALEDAWWLYLERRHAYYARELRWPVSPFWARRRSNEPQIVSGREYHLS